MAAAPTNAVVTNAPEYDLLLALRALRRYWWLVVAIPAVALLAQVAQIRTAPFQAQFRAVVVLPGDTDDPGRSERPELMIMDDVPRLVGSALFAERVRAQLEIGGVVVESGRIAGSLSATRYARTVTVVARDDEEEVAVAVASAAEAAFAGAVNEALVAGLGQTATITIIDPVDGARRGEPDQWRVAIIVTAAMGFVGMLAALVVDGARRSASHATRR